MTTQIIDSKGCSFLSQFLEDLPDNIYLEKVLTGCGNKKCYNKVNTLLEDTNDHWNYLSS